MTAAPSYEVIIEGVITGTYGTSWATYGNFYVKDANGDEILVYGLYDATGETRYDAMTTKPVEGDTIKVQSVVSFYNNVAQLKNAKLIAHTAATPDEGGDEPGGEPDVDGTQIVFDFGANGDAAHVDGNDMASGSSFTVDGYTLTFTDCTKAYKDAFDATGKSCIKLGTSSLVGTVTFEVPSNVKAVIINAAKYKAKNTVVTANGAQTTINTSSNDGAYTPITVDTSTNKTVTIATVSGKTRTMIDSIIFVLE